MGRVVFLVRAMPSGSDVNLDTLLSRITQTLPDGFKIHDSRKEPIAFGMEALLLQVSMPDEEGFPQKLEEYLRSFSEVEEISVESFTRI